MVQNTVFNRIVVICVVAKNGSFGFAKRWLVCQAKPNVPFVRLAEKFQNILCGGKKIKTQKGRQGVSAYSLSKCCIVSMSLVTCQNGLLFLFLVVCLLLSGRSLHLLPTFRGLKKWRFRITNCQPTTKVCRKHYCLINHFTRHFF